MPHSEFEIDFIGDLHGRAELLQQALHFLGYRHRGACWRHSCRKVVFLGDMLNRGPEIRDCCRMVRDMVDRGQAIFLLGNHELFALQEAVAEKSGPGPVNGLTEKARRHLAGSRASFARHRGEWRELREWLGRCPLVWQTKRVRAVHACWHPVAAAYWLGRTLRPEYLLPPPNWKYFSMLWLVDGPSLRHPVTGARVRIRWWEQRARHWGEMAYTGQSDIPPAPLSTSDKGKACPYPPDDPPCFFGHYGFPKPVEPLRPNLACLDLAVAKGGSVGVYRWNGELRLQPDSFFAFGS